MKINPKTPGVYIQEENAFPSSVVQVPTAIPAFIGYTPKAEKGGKSLLFKPVEISSFAEFLTLFGYPENSSTQEPLPQYSPSYYITKQETKPPKGESYPIDGNIYTIEPDPNTIYYLYNSIQLFFQNGGNQAYIVSTGSYGSPSGKAIEPSEQIINPNILLKDLQKGLAALKMVPSVTMYLFPEATLLSPAENGTLMESTLLQCNAMQTAVAIFDVIGGREPDPILWQDDIQNFRNATGNQFLNYGIAYYPFLRTTIVSINQISYENFNGGDTSVLGPILNPSSAPNPKAQTILNNIKSGNLTTAQNSAALQIASPNYKYLLSILQEKINILPPSGGMAGVYTLVDDTRGVWVAPANVSIVGVTDITIKINDQHQENLNVDPFSGKSINAIRFFNGRGILVWGARTLDGNSMDWRYISVRRTLIMIEQSIRLAISTYTFSTNDKNTWTSIETILNNFLTNLWKQGALAGSKPADAFEVRVGLGTTMTAQDILEGFVKVSVSLAISHPAEFIILNFTQELAKP